MFFYGVEAATLEVGSKKPYSTIQSAIIVASTSDTVLVYPGTYTENITFDGKAITVKSANGPGVTFIDGSASDNVVTFAYGEGQGSVLEGFTIKNGFGSGIFCYSSSPVITNCTITENSTYAYGGGISCSYSSSPVITNCTITGNTAELDGGGIDCYSSSPVITNCTITGNTAYSSGGGIDCYSSSPVITNCTITGNTATFGGGIYCWVSSPVITNCTISRNTTDYDGGGIYCIYSSSPVITNCIISVNSAGYDGGGIYCIYFSPTVITNCTIFGNTASQHGGGIYCSASSPTVKNSILWEDAATVGGNEIYPDSSTITVTYSDVQGGWAGTANINADPLFVGIWNLHLQTGSPCENTGTTAGAPQYDFEGNPRLAPVGGDNMPDMGADELAIKRLLWKHTSGAANIWKLDSSDTFDFVNFKVYGPFAGWTPIDYHRNADGTARLLWENTNGAANIWKLDSSDTFDWVSFKVYGPFAGWTPLEYEE